MHGDFSRLTHSNAKGYTAVWSQQGRVQLDADANEQTAIVRDWLRTLAVDFIGPFGGHVTRAGFTVALDRDDLSFAPGHYYVHGLRCEVTLPQGSDVSKATYRGMVPDSHPLPEPPYLVQMLVWERSVSAVVDPDLLEPALGPDPPDTTVRTQVVWVPSVSTALPVPTPLGTPLRDLKPADLDAESITSKFEEYNAAGLIRPMLVARVDRDIETDEASIVPTTSGYLGLENQLYRVEVHVGGTAGAATFKWSRDNGSVEFRIVDLIVEEAKPPASVAKVIVASLGRDERTGLAVGDWVELVDDTTSPYGTPQPLRRVQAIDRVELVVTLDGVLAPHLARHPYLRRWDQRPEGKAGADGLPIVESSAEDPKWLDLEDGVEVRFPADGGVYRRGDYWLIPARRATGGLLWPGGAHPMPVPPHGPTRYLVPLALVHADRTVEDMRTLFTHLAWPEPGRSIPGKEP